MSRTLSTLIAKFTELFFAYCIHTLLPNLLTVSIKMITTKIIATP